MTDTKPYLLKLPADLHRQVEDLARKNLRSVRAEIETAVREYVRKQLTQPPKGESRQ
jgi:BMFP domain-containing protein YqiC